MKIKYADRMAGMGSTELADILQLTKMPEVISFAGGLPAKESFPVEDYKKVSEKVLSESGAIALQYGPSEGLESLRKHIVKRLEKVQVDADYRDIVVTGGSQQGLDFSAKLFINPGDVIVCEAPTYLGALTAFQAYEPKYVEVETDDNGMIMEDLEEKLKNTENVKFIYVIPDFQNPTGKTLPYERRKKIVELANKYDVIIIEDNPYGELRFKGEILPAIKHFDTEGRVVFLGTFSKILSPGIRLGWVYASPEIIKQYDTLKQSSDLQASTLVQMEAARYLDEYDIDEHVQKIIDLYYHRKQVMIKAMEREFPEGVTWTNPDGGLFLWVVLPENINAKELYKKAVEQNVAFVPGGAFYPSGKTNNCFRMNYSCMAEDLIEEGIKRLGKVLKEEINK